MSLSSISANPQYQVTFDSYYVSIKRFNPIGPQDLMFDEGAIDVFEVALHTPDHDVIFQVSSSRVA